MKKRKILKFLLHLLTCGIKANSNIHNLNGLFKFNGVVSSHVIIKPDFVELRHEGQEFIIT